MGPVLLYIKIIKRQYKKANFRLTSLTNLELSFHSHTYESAKWIQLYIKTSLGSFWSLPKSGHISHLFKGFKWIKYTDSSVQFSSVNQSCPTLCDPMNHSTPGLRVHHKFPEFTQTHIHWAGDAIHQSHPLSSPSPPAPNPSQHHS